MLCYQVAPYRIGLETPKHYISSLLVNHSVSLFLGLFHSPCFDSILYFVNTLLCYPSHDSLGTRIWGTDAVDVSHSIYYSKRTCNNMEILHDKIEELKTTETGIFVL